jgi:hypothetical protein
MSEKRRVCSAVGAEQIDPAKLLGPSNEPLSAPLLRNHCSVSIVFLTFTIVVALALVWIGAIYEYHPKINTPPAVGDTSIQAVVERIITIESNGDPNKKNKRSSATGAGQFLDDTWLELVQKHRHDLMQGRSKKEVLDLRRDLEVSREIMTRFVEQNALMLSKRNLTVTPGTLYLTYFAGPAGALAVLSVSDDADAASLMASASCPLW